MQIRTLFFLVQGDPKKNGFILDFFKGKNVLCNIEIIDSQSIKSVDPLGYYQPLYFSYGGKMDQLIQFIPENQLGKPLVFDSKSVSDMIQKLDIKSPTLLFVHGNSNPKVQSIYEEISFQLNQSIDAFYTIFNIKTPESQLVAYFKTLKERGIQKLYVQSLLMNRGGHVENDLLKRFVEPLKNEGFLIEIEVEGLLQRRKILEIFYERIKEVNILSKF